MNSANWWANKLGTPPVRQNPGPAPMMPPTPTYPQPQYQQPPIEQRPPMPVNRCPGCGSANYAGTAESRPRCYDCGYPVVQSGSGTKGVTQPNATGPTQAAYQVPTGGWNPDTIVDRIG